MQINLHNFLAHSTENGPELRAVVWVQGCTLNCPGCFNPETHDIHRQQLISVEELAHDILAITDIEGVTISGGEPFLQAAALAELGAILQEAKLGIILFSGFPYDTLIQSRRTDWERLLTVTDLLIAGPFIKKLACDLALRGSSNQTLHYLSDRYAAYHTTFMQDASRVEIQIDATGHVMMTGFPAETFLESFM